MHRSWIVSIALIVCVAFGVRTADQAGDPLLRSFVGNLDESYDEPQMGVEEQALLSLKAGRRVEGEGVDVVAERRRPARGIEVIPGMTFRMCLNGNQFALGHPPRIFLFIENRSGKPVRWRRGSEKWEGLTLRLWRNGVGVEPSTHYQYYQWLFKKKRYRFYSTRRMDTNLEYVYCGRIEDVFGELKPAKYVLEVQAHPAVYLEGVENEPVLEIQKFEFEVLNRDHKYRQNALGPSDLGKKQHSLEWANTKSADREINVVRVQVGLPPMDSLARMVDDIPAAPELPTASNALVQNINLSNTSGKGVPPRVETASPELNGQKLGSATSIWIAGSLGVVISIGLLAWRRR